MPAPLAIPAAYLTAALLGAAVGSLITAAAYEGLVKDMASRYGLSKKENKELRRKLRQLMDKCNIVLA